MMATLGLTIDISGVVAGVKKMTAKIENARMQSMLDIGHEIMRLSQMEVPHDEGSLQNSGTVERVGKEVVVGYHREYAARLHEHPEYKFQKGRKGKYLSDPIARNARILGLRFADEFGKGIK